MVRRTLSGMIDTLSFQPCTSLCVVNIKGTLLFAMVVTGFGVTLFAQVIVIVEWRTEEVLMSNNRLEMAKGDINLVGLYRNRKLPMLSPPVFVMTSVSKGYDDAMMLGWLDP